MMDTRIEAMKPLLAPAFVLDELPVLGRAKETILRGRREVEAILSGEDRRLLVVLAVPPVWSEEQLAALAENVTRHDSTALKILISLQVQLSRRTTGWKGVILDPTQDGSFNVNVGIRKVRKTLLSLAELGVATGIEFVDPMLPQFLTDCVCWAAFGPENTESQLHRQLASALSVSVGFHVRSTNWQAGCDAVESSHFPHHFMSLTKDGKLCIVRSSGNQVKPGTDSNRSHMRFFLFTGTLRSW